LTSLDGEPIGTSKRLLLTLVGRAENPNMGWNAARDSVGANWGQGPIYASSPAGTMKLWTSAQKAQVWALDERGERRFPVPSQLKNGALKFSPSNLWRTVWYEIELS